jgi:hypothetical protein
MASGVDISSSSSSLPEQVPVQQVHANHDGNGGPIQAKHLLEHRWIKTIHLFYCKTFVALLIPFG